MSSPLGMLETIPSGCVKSEDRIHSRIWLQCERRTVSLLTKRSQERDLSQNVSEVYRWSYSPQPEVHSVNSTIKRKSSEQQQHQHQQQRQHQHHQHQHQQQPHQNQHHHHQQQPQLQHQQNQHQHQHRQHEQTEQTPGISVTATKTSSPNHPHNTTQHYTTQPRARARDQTYQKL